MSFNYNHITLVGRLTKDVVLTKVAESTKSTFSLAVDRPYRKDDGSADTDFIPCVVWGKLAEISEKYLKKGSPVLVEGRLQIRSYTVEGVKKYFTEVLLENFQVLETLKK